MTVTLTEHRIPINDGDSITNWVGTITLGTTDPAPIESTGWVGAAVGVAIFDSYIGGLSLNLSNAVIYCWVFSRLALGNTTDANGGLMVSVGEATNLGAWKVAGADRAAFRHDDGPTGWMCPALDTQSLPASPLSRAGSAASVNFSAVTRVGTTVNSLVAAPGMNPNYNADIIRYLDPTLNDGCAISIIGGTSGAGAGTFADIAAADRSSGDQQGHGVLRQIAAGTFGCQGPLRFGNATGTASSWFEDTNAVLVFEARGFRTTLYKIFITDNGTGTTTFILTNCALIAPTGVGASFNSLTDTDVTAVTVTGTRISGFTQGIGIGGGVGQQFTNCVFAGSGAVSITSQPVLLTDTTISGSTVAADASALFWNVNADTNSYLSGMTFEKGTGTNDHHAIQLGANTPSEITFANMTFTGFGAGATNGSALYNNSGKAITVNISGGSVPTVKNGAGASTNVVSSVPISVKVVDKDNANIQNARVAIYLTSDNSVVTNQLTDANGEISASFGGTTPASIYVRIRQSSTGTTRYFPINSSGTIASGTGYSATVTLIEDTIAAA